jgi:hypothetical protein
MMIGFYIVIRKKKKLSSENLEKSEKTEKSKN